MAAINTYLTFNGDCEKAFLLYQSVLGGQILQMAYFRDIPDTLPEDAEKVMHVSMKIGEQSILMGSDSTVQHGGVVTPGDNFSISVNAASKEEADIIYNGLSDRGTTTMPMADTFWGAYFGMLKDQFGINWMVNFDYPHAHQQ